MYDLVQRETDKYRRAWGVDYAGRKSFGLRVAPTALKWAESHGCERVTDWGSGSGAARDVFEDAGLATVGVDLVPEEAGDFRPDTFAACIWDLPPEFPTTDFAFSSDMLEHIPTARVEDTLRAIRDHTRRAGFFQISTRPDKLGRHIGETLHLTVRSAGWWHTEVARFFNVERVVATKRDQVRLWLSL